MGAYASLSAVDLGVMTVKELLRRANIDPESEVIDEVVFGQVLQAGVGQNPARQVALGAGLPVSTPCTTVNKVCGSSLKAAMMAANSVRAGEYKAIIAGGMESMTNAPYLLPAMRDGARIGHKQVIDHMFLDGLEDAYDKGRLMGTFAEDCAEAFQFTRDAQDQYAIASLDNALDAERSGAFAREITPVTVHARTGEEVITRDEQPARARPEKIPHLKPAFRKDGTVTAANSSSISDGAAALVMTTLDEVERSGATPRARVLGHASHAQAPNLFPTAPIPAAQKLLDRIGWKKSDVDLWEVNEAFAVVPMAFMREMGLPRDIVNVNGGACALGHPIGASGARIIVTLLNALETRGLKRGVAAICIGGGEGTAIAIERM